MAAGGRSVGHGSENCWRGLREIFEMQPLVAFGLADHTAAMGTPSLHVLRVLI